MLTGPELFLQKWPPVPGLEMWKRSWKRDSLFLYTVHQESVQGSPKIPTEERKTASVTCVLHQHMARSCTAPALAPGKGPGWRAVDKGFLLWWEWPRQAAELETSLLGGNLAAQWGVEVSSSHCWQHPEHTKCPGSFLFVSNCSYRLLRSFLQERQSRGNQKPLGFGGSPAANVQPIYHSLGTNATKYFILPLTTLGP